MVPVIDDVEKEKLSNNIKNNGLGIWDAFKSQTFDEVLKESRFEKEINMPKELEISTDNLLACAVCLGALVSSEKKVEIGVYSNKYQRCIEVDTTKVQEIDDIKDWVSNLFENESIDKSDVKVPIDIEVIDEDSNVQLEAIVGLIIRDGKCLLSVKNEYINHNMCEHLLKLTLFSFEKIIHSTKTPEAELMAPHYNYKEENNETFVERIFKYKKTKPLEFAIIDDACDEKITYEKLWNTSEAIVDEINKKIIPNESCPKIALFMERSWKHIATLIAIQRMGGTCILIDSLNPDNRLQCFLDESKPDAIISTGNLIERASNLAECPVYDFDAIIKNYHNHEIEYESWIESVNKISFIAGTSGSTGKPKAVCLSYSGMKHTINSIIKAANLAENSKGTWLSSPGYGMIEVDPLPVLYSGATLYIPSKDILKDVRLLAKWFIEREITNTLLMTSMAEAIWTINLKTELSTMLIAGERCKHWPPSSVDYTVMNVYGSAEAAVVSIEDLSNTHKTIMPSVGKAIPGVNLYVVDNNGKELPACCIGELVITGKTLSVGYINKEQTNKSFKKNTLDSTSEFQYISGDRARISLEGTLEVFGRTDSLVKIRGHRVDLAEVEVNALKVSGVSKAAVCCFEKNSGTILALFIEQEKEAKDIKEKVRQFLQKQLPSASQPNIIKVTTLPLGVNGKVDYKALRNYSLYEENDEKSFCPTTKIESAVQECWLKWTKCKNANLEDNFFEIGGDSLKAMCMMGDLDFKHGLHIEMSTFLKNPILSNLIHLANSVNDSEMPIFKHLPLNKQDESFELNESQQSLWIGRGSDFNYGGVGCQGYFEWESVNLDYEKFVTAVGLLINRHPMLRMTINKDGKQVIGKYDVRKVVKYRDLSNLPKKEIDYEIDKIRDYMANKEIGTEQWPLFNFEVSKISSDKSRIHFCIDMLIADAWSIFQTIVPDLIDLYAGKAGKLPELKTTFHDYVEYKQKIKESKQYNEHKEYWLKKIKELPPAPKLQVIDNDSSNKKVKFDRYEGTLEKESWTSLKYQAQKRRISPSGVVALVLCEVLRAWSEEDRFTLNFPVSDRMPVSDDIDLVVGDFTNTLLVPYETNVNDTFENKGRCLQDAIWEALDHRLFSGVEVLRELSKIHRTGRDPLMPVVLTSLLGHPGRHDVSKLGREVYGVSQTPQVMLDVQIRESDDVLYFKWDYLKGVIRPDVIKDMFEAFETLLKQLAKEENIWNRTYIDLRPKKQIEIRNKVNDTEVDIPKVHLRDLLVNRIEDRAKETAIISKNGTYNWNNVGRGASYIKNMLKEICNDEEKFIGIILPKGPAQFMAVYGCLLFGAGYVPIDVDLPQDRVKKIFKQAKIKTAIASQQTVVPEGFTKIEYCDTDIESKLAENIDLTLEPLRENYSPYIIFTSGSTGEPKGVEIPEIAVINHIYDVVRRFKLDSNTRHLATAALHFDMSVFDVFGPLLHGGSVVIPEYAVGPIPETWLELQREFKINFWACVPAIMELVCCIAETEEELHPVESLKNIVMAGDWIPLTLIPRIRALFPSSKLFSCGGPTETTNWSIVHEINDLEGSMCNSVIYGAPMSNSKYHIVSKNWIECPDWVPGEMVVESDVSLARGYIGNPEISKKAFVSHPISGKRMYHTGDLGRYLPNGEIEILGRIDNQIKINGLRIELGEIEKVAQTCDGVLRACAVTIPDASGKPKQIALAYLADGTIDKSIIGEKLEESLPNYMVPKNIKQVATLPLSKNGKVDVKALREILLTKENKVSSTFNKNETLRNILGVFGANLNQQVILPDDNFFDLGGDSLSAMKIKIELEAKLSIKTSLESIMLSNTIGELVNEISQRG